LRLSQTAIIGFFSKFSNAADGHYREPGAAAVAAGIFGAQARLHSVSVGSA